MSKGVDPVRQLKVHVVGIGMIGGSIAARLREQHWRVTGNDVKQDRIDEAMRRGIIESAGDGADADITVIATPVSAVVAEVAAALGRSKGVVTDVASVKSPVHASIVDPRFVGGHPMAGSELSGLDGVNADLFDGATWVITSPLDALSTQLVCEMVETLGARPLSLTPIAHDDAVATISHVPHLLAAVLMTSATSSDVEKDSRGGPSPLQLAAGGFRDMTRIAAGDPNLWADIVVANGAAIDSQLLRITDALAALREYVRRGERVALCNLLQQARVARQELPTRSHPTRRFAIVRVGIPDRPGAIGSVLHAFIDRRVNVENLEIVHDPKGDRGTLLVTIPESSAPGVAKQLRREGVPVSVEEVAS